MTMRSPWVAAPTSGPLSFRRRVAAGLNSRGSRGGGPVGAAGAAGAVTGAGAAGGLAGAGVAGGGAGGTTGAAGRFTSQTSTSATPPSACPPGVSLGYEKPRSRRLPCWETVRSLAGAGTKRSGGSGGPFLPQPATRAAAPSRASRKSRPMNGWGTRRPAPEDSEDIAREILVLNDALQGAEDILGIHLEGHPRHLGGIEGDLVEQPLHEGREAAGADILGGRVDLDREARQLGHRVLGELEGHPLGRQQGRILLGERRLRLG